MPVKFTMPDTGYPVVSDPAHSPDYLAGRAEALEEAALMIEKARETTCVRCGAPRSNHPYRHPFIGDYPPDLAAAIRALKETPR